jgi:hypothetical protein
MKPLYRFGSPDVRISRQVIFLPKRQKHCSILIFDLFSKNDVRFADIPPSRFKIETFGQAEAKVPEIAPRDDSIQKLLLQRIAR